MSKVELLNIVKSGDVSLLNTNFDRIQAEFQNKVLYRDNPENEPNTLETDVDCNGQRLYNLPAPSNENEAARLKDVVNAVAGIVPASFIPFTPAPSISSSNVQGAIKEVQGNIPSLSNSISSTSATTAASSLAVKTVNDKAVEANNNALAAVKRSGDTMTGNLVIVGDLFTFRPAAPNTGVIYFGSSTSRCLYYDGTQYILPLSDLLVGGDVYANNVRLAKITDIPAQQPSIGNGQTWQDVTSSRVAGTTYYNTTTKPIAVSFYVGTLGSAVNAILYVNTVPVWTSYSSGANVNHNGFAIVPPGGSYSLTVTTGTMTKWLELR